MVSQGMPVRLRPLEACFLFLEGLSFPLLSNRQLKKNAKQTQRGNEAARIGLLDGRGQASKRASKRVWRGTKT